MHVSLVLIILQEFLLHVKNGHSVSADDKFSNIDMTYVANYKIVRPEISYKIHRKRRDLTNSLSYEQEDVGKLIKVGDWLLELNPENNLLIRSNFRTEWVTNKGTARRNGPDCDYKSGFVFGVKNSFAAITICDKEVSGYFDTGTDKYFVRPLKSPEHILYKNSELAAREKRSISNDNSSITQWEYFNLTGDVIDIDNGGAESKDKQELNKENSDRNSQHANKSHKWYREQLDSEEMGYFYDSAWEANTYSGFKKLQKLASTNRLWLEVAIGVDNTVISFHGRKNVEKYVLSLMNIVNGIFQDSSLGASIQLVVTRLLLYESTTYQMIQKADAKKSLLNVNNWNKRLLLSLAPGEPRHDLAFWLTRNFFGGPSGYAPIAGVCDANRSCSLNRDEGLSSAFIIAHEMGHILGLQHDGDEKAGNNCTDQAQEGSIMAPMIISTFNKFLWSDCSREEFKNNAHKWSCLLNEPDVSEVIYLNTTLGSTFTLDQQCRMEFGKGYSSCEFNIAEPCTHLWCEKDKSKMCKTKKGPPLEGTECGFQKWCVNKYCQDIDMDRLKKQQVLQFNPVNGGWNEWSAWSSCSRTCGVGVEFRTRLCNKPEPAYGGNECEGLSEEWKTCKKKICPEPLTDMRAQQCQNLPKLLNANFISPINLTLLPYESADEDEKCKLLCIVKETRELYKTDDNLVDGTLCSYDHSSNICVQGKCQMVGCEGVLRSKMSEDNCGVCNGHNAECEHVVSTYRRKLKREENKIARVPRMTRNITIDVNISIFQDTMYPAALIFKDRKKKIHSILIPNTRVDTNIIAGTKFYYEQHDFRHKIWGKGPVLAELLLFIHTTSSNSHLNATVKTEYFIHKSLTNVTTRFEWIVGGWSPCSSSCGGGRRSKTVACFDKRNNKIAPRRRCSFITKPRLETEKCNTFNFNWIPGAWEPCSQTCGSSGVQFRELYCVPHTDNYDHIASYVHENKTAEIWKLMVNPGKCLGGARPGNRKSCNRTPCPSYWQYGDWSQCSVSCGQGHSVRQSHCPPPDGETFFSCGPAPQQQKRKCRGLFNAGNHKLCRGLKRRACQRDQTEYCTLSVLSKYCKIRGFRQICCKSCANYRLKPITAGTM